MPSTYLFVVGTILLSVNFVRFFGLAVADWFYLGAMIMALAETARFERRNLRCWTRNRFIWMAGLILLGAIMSTSHALFLHAAIIEIFQQLYVVTLFVSLIWIMVQRGKTNTIVQAFIWSGVFTALIAVVDYFAGTSFGPQLSGTPDVQFWGRYIGSLGHPNKLGYYLVLSSILSIEKWIEIDFKRSRFMAKFLWGLLVFVQVFGIYLSGSLTAYLGFSLGVVALVAFSKTLKRRIAYYVVPVLLLGVPALLFSIIFGNDSVLNSSYLEPPLISAALNRVETVTAYSRWYIFQEAIDSIYENPLVGIGYDQISTSGIRVDFRQLEGTIHNVFLQNWYIGGFFAFLGWLFIYINLGRIAITTAWFGERKDVAPVLLGIATATLSIILMDQFQDALYQREKWLVFGLLLGQSWNLSIPKIIGNRPSD